MTAADKLLAHLQGVKRAGDGKWMARCPVHDDRTASLSIKDDGGRVLLNCFGCGANGGAIVDALGLRLSDLYDGPLPEVRKNEQQRLHGISPYEAIVALDHEILVAVILIDDATKRPLTPDEITRLSTAAQRIGKVRDTYAALKIRKHAQPA